MHFATIQRILGLLLMVASATMLPPMLIGLWMNEPSWADFAVTLVFVFVAGALFWYPVRRKRQELRVRDGFVVVALFWAVLALVGAIPLVLADQPCAPCAPVQNAVLYSPFNRRLDGFAYIAPCPYQPAFRHTVFRKEPNESVFFRFVFSHNCHSRQYDDRHC